MKYLITYDIENDKRRKKISDELEAFGYRVNYSVFECELNQTKLRKLKEKIEELVDVKYDSVRFYRDWETDRKSTRLNSSHSGESRMPSSA